ncbi:MAG: trypsin-like peptidase domain-containing protein [Anaerolineales bacterium]|nr:trypsin-like peptidase domain-containing protein [Anaerolineales bacterium]
MDNRYKYRLILLVVLLFSLLFTACSTSSPELTVEPTTDKLVATSAKESEGISGAVSSLEGVQEATILIEAQGTFVDPEMGMMINTAGRGTGFIIDPSGIAVTNNHVVTGAALLKVWVAGDDRALNARILGVSECSDLAVIDIEGDGFPFLDWYVGDVGVGLEVFAAGFPLGDPEFTLTKGIVSKARADGESSWASVDFVLEHDATINPGNSGGPLVDSQGKVVGVNYAYSVVAQNQYFAIKAEEAQSVIDRLTAGEDVDSVGINGVAVASSDGSVSGIWVSSVASGSPADMAGIQAGDIITSLEGLVLATDETMADYCDVLRTHGTEATLSIEVLRFETGEILEGQLNGRDLQASASLSGQIRGGIPSPGSAGYASYTYVMDDTAALELEIPTDWGQVDGSEWYEDGEIVGASLWASPDIESFMEGWDTPGVIFDVTPRVDLYGSYLDFLDLLTEALPDFCEFGGRFDYEDNLYRGAYDLYESCGGTGTSYLVLTAFPIDDPGAFLIELDVQIVSDADLEAFENIIASFNVVGSLPGGSAMSGGFASTGDGYSEYMWVYDDYESIQMQVPSGWNDIDGSFWDDGDDVVGGMITASPDLDGFLTTWGTPGVIFGASDDYASYVGYQQLLDIYRADFMDPCELDGRYDYEDAIYRGKYDLFTKCGGPGGAQWLQLAAVAKDDQFAFLILVQAQIVNEEDWEVVDQILATFEVVGELP